MRLGARGNVGRTRRKSYAGRGAGRANGRRAGHTTARTAHVGCKNSNLLAVNKGAAKQNIINLSTTLVAVPTIVLAIVPVGALAAAIASPGESPPTGHQQRQ